MLAHLLGLLLSGVGPLIILLVGRGDGFADDQAREALNFQLTVLVGLIVGGILTGILIGIAVIIVVLVADVVFSVIASAEAYAGRTYRYPVTLRLIKAAP